MSSDHTISGFPYGSSCGEGIAVRGNALTISSPAKLNVFLEVRSKRPDGYHELDTVMLRTEFADQLTVRPIQTSALSLRFSEATSEALQSGVPLDHRNLILQAAAAMKLRLGIATGAEFTLHKRIPPESGLGGGSSNAAAALLLCRQLWQPDVSDSVLHEIAAALGSDINFFLSRRAAAVCHGRGEIIEPIRLARKYYFVALRPSQGNSTATVFRSMSLPERPRTSKCIVDVLSGHLEASLESHLFNRLTEAAGSVNPAMSTLIERVTRLSRKPVFMSGSGSTVFVACSGHPEATRLQAHIRASLHQSTWLLCVVPDDVSA